MTVRRDSRFVGTLLPKRHLSGLEVEKGERGDSVFPLPDEAQATVGCYVLKFFRKLVFIK